jgi:hypothetical protein
VYKGYIYIYIHTHIYIEYIKQSHWTESEHGSCVSISSNINVPSGQKFFVRITHDIIKNKYTDYTNPFWRKILCKPCVNSIL